MVRWLGRGGSGAVLVVAGLLYWHERFHRESLYKVIYSFVGRLLVFFKTLSPSPNHSIAVDELNLY